MIDAASTAEERLAAYEVATALLLKRSLRNGAASSVHSIKHRSLADQLMPPVQWLKHKGSFARTQTLPKTLGAYLGDYKPELTSQVAALDAAITAGDIGLREDARIAFDERRHARKLAKALRDGDQDDQGRRPDWQRP